jgi:hypothetical protein
MLALVLDQKDFLDEKLVRDAYVNTVRDPRFLILLDAAGLSLAELMSHFETATLDEGRDILHTLKQNMNVILLRDMYTRRNSESSTLEPFIPDPQMTQLAIKIREKLES